MKLHIEEIRESKGISLSKLAKLIGISKSALFYIERGATQPKLITMCRIAKALDVHVVELFSYEDD